MLPRIFELHDSDGKKWLLHNIRATSGKNYLGTGWKKVVKEKSLELGDTCVFGLDDIKKCKLMVFTFGDTGNFQMEFNRLESSSGRV